MTDKLTGYTVPETPIGEERLQYYDTPRRSWHNSFRTTLLKLRRLERTEMAIATATKIDQPITLRGSGRLYVSICLCPEGNATTFPRSND